MKQSVLMLCINVKINVESGSSRFIKLALAYRSCIQKAFCKWNDDKVLQNRLSSKHALNFST